MITTKHIESSKAYGGDLKGREGEFRNPLGINSTNQLAMQELLQPSATSTV